MFICRRLRCQNHCTCDHYVFSCRKLFFNDCGIKVHNVSKSYGSEINEVVRWIWKELTIVSGKCATSNIQTIKLTSDDNERWKEQHNWHCSSLFTQETKVEFIIDLRRIQEIQRSKCMWIVEYLSGSQIWIVSNSLSYLIQTW